ncbi:MAG TPA: cache domain-containing protein, partial [Candidatus Sulfotelmatobacter sp.]|nr:cache domain-containing protein [Candidatus Sulfotelmatobacter sp.]
MSSSGSKAPAVPWLRAARQAWWQRIGFRLTLLVLLVCTLPPLMLGILAMRSARVAQEREIREQHAMLAAWGVDKVRSYLGGITEDMHLAIQLCDLQTMDVTAARPYLAYLLSFIEDVKQVTLIDDRGQERIKLAENALFTDEDLQSQASTDMFQAAMRGEHYTGPVRTSAFSEPFVTVALPIRRLEEDRVVGVLAAEINLKRLWDEMLSFKVGQSGYLYVVNGEGQLIAHPDFSLVLARRDVSKIGAVRRFLQGLDDTVPGPNPEYLNYQGVPVVGVQAAIPKLGWGVIVEQPSTEAFANVNRMKIETTLILLNAMAVTLVLAFIAAQNLTKPLAELAQGARLLGAGNFAHRIPVRSADEIGEVA